MRKMKRLGRRAAGLLLAAALAFSGALLYAVADAVTDWFSAELGSLSAKYETNPKYGPGTVATVSGDPGGTSYGLYMFTRNANTPMMFVEWLLQQEDPYYLYVGQTLQYAYNHDTNGKENPGYGTNFDNTWKALAGGDNDPKSPFGRAQTAFTKARFYDALRDKVEQGVSGFKMDNYSEALQNVFWSRAVQHGVSGAYNVVTRAISELGGFKNQSESELIAAIYAESGKVTTGYANYMSGTDARKYGVEGKSLAYYTGCSGDVQMSVFMRLNFKEPTDAQELLFGKKYINADGNSRLAVDEGIYRLSDGEEHYLLVAENKAVVGNGQGTDLSLTYFVSDYYTITFSGTDTRLSEAGGAVVPESASAGENQMWRLENVNGGYTLQNRGSGKYLTVISDEGGKRLSLTDAADKATAWRFDLAGNGWSTSAMHFPSQSTALEVGSSGFSIWGTIRSSSRITGVTVATSTAGGLPIAAASASAAPNSLIYNLNKLDSKIKISALGEGEYVFTVRATNANGDTVTLVESPFTVYAPSKITVTFDPNGGAITAGSPTKTITAGSVYGDMPEAAVQGGAFLGWFTERTGGEAVSVTDVPPLSNHTLYAHYANTHTVTFKDRSGSVIATAALAPGAVISAPANPATWSDGSYAYTFKQWVSGSTVYENGVTVMGESDLVFTPEYNKQALTGGETGTGSGTGTGSDTGSGTGTGGISLGGSELTGFVPGTSVSSFAASMGATVYKADGASQVTSGNVGTGMIAKIGSSSFTIVVKGDTNGDGAMSISDVVKLQSHVVGRSTLSGAYATAGDLNGDGRISITDVVQAAQIVVGKRTLG